MAVYYIDLPGHKEAHQRYHMEHNTPCNHDCRYYEDVGDPHAVQQRDIIRRTLAVIAEINPPCEMLTDHDQIFIDRIRIAVFHPYRTEEESED